MSEEREQDGEPYSVRMDTSGERVLHFNGSRPNQITADELKPYLDRLYEVSPMDLNDIDYSPTQLGYMVFIQEFRGKNTFSPTYREMGKHFGVTKITAYNHIEELVKKGAIKKEKYRARGIVPLRKVKKQITL